MTTNRWPGRQVAVAAFIPPGASVLDLGMGGGGLRERLPAGCRYTGADMPEFDMNKGKWPEGSFDVVVMSGVLEYARYPAAVFRHLADLAPTAIVTYSHGGRRDSLWANDISRESFTEMAARAGFAVEEVGSWRAPRIEPQAIWRLTRSD